MIELYSKNKLTKTATTRDWISVYLVFFLLAFILAPIISGFFYALILKYGPYDSTTEFGDYFYLGWAMSMVYGGWSLYFLNLIPYAVFYADLELYKMNIFIRYAFFYLILLFFGIVLPSASHAGMFNSLELIDFRAFTQLALLTITVCPLCELILNGYLFKKKLA